MNTILKLTAVCVFATLAVPAANALTFDDASVIVLARADDPAGDQRRGRGTDDRLVHQRVSRDDRSVQVLRSRGADDSITHQRRGADDPANDGRRGRGADDPAGDARRGRGADDAPNHG